VKLFEFSALSSMAGRLDFRDEMHDNTYRLVALGCGKALVLVVVLIGGYFTC
jgi:hypothetical protein